jgi:hypothetical protein
MDTRQPDSAGDPQAIRALIEQTRAIRLRVRNLVMRLQQQRDQWERDAAGLGRRLRLTAAQRERLRRRPRLR